MLRLISLCLALFIVVGCTNTPDRFVSVEHSAMPIPVGKTFSIQASGMDTAPADLSRLRTALMESGMLEASADEADYIVTHWLTTTRRPATVDAPIPLPEIGIDPTTGTPILHKKHVSAPSLIEYAILSVVLMDGEQWRMGGQHIAYEAHAATALDRSEHSKHSAARRLIKAVFKDFPQQDGRSIVSTDTAGEHDEETTTN